MINYYLNTSGGSPISESEFNKLIKKLEERNSHKENTIQYIIAYSFAYHCGYGLKDIEKLKREDLDKIDLPDNFNNSWINFIPLKVKRRSFQRHIKEILGKPFTSLKVGFILKKLNQGYSLGYIAKKLNYSTRWRENRLIREQVTKNLGGKKRLKVFERDGFKCVYCGRSPPEVKLEADHITPVSKGGKNYMNNLQTLCELCNLQKHNKLIKKD